MKCIKLYRPLSPTQHCSYQKVLALWAPVKSSGDQLKQCSVIWSNNGKEAKIFSPLILQHNYNCNGYPMQDLKQDPYTHTHTHRPLLPGEQLRGRLQRRWWFLVNIWVCVGINPSEEILKGEFFFCFQWIKKTFLNL